jgi:hypothetical protein
MIFETIAELAKALSENSVKSLDDSNFEKVLQAPLNLSELNLLSEAAKKNSSITHLHLKMEDKYDLFDTTGFYKALAKLPKLRTFQVFQRCSRSAGGTGHHCEINFSGIATLVQECKHLKSLEIQNDCHESVVRNIELMSEAISHHPSLEDIRLFGIQDSLENLENIFRAMATIKTLKRVDVEFDPAYNGAVDSCKHIHHVFQAPALETCGLEHFEFEGDAFASVIGANQSLKSLAMRHCRETCGQTVNIAKALSSHKTMTSCKLKWLQLGPEFCAAFSEGLAQNMVMADLKIEGVPEEQVACLRHIAAAIESNQALTRLFIKLEEYPIPLEFYQALSTALPQNSTLEKICLFPSTVPKGGYEALARGLAANSSVWRLEIGGAVDEPGGVVEIVHAAQTNKKLRIIVFHCSRGISRNQVIIALNGLAGNTTLEYLCLWTGMAGAEETSSLPDKNEEDEASLLEAVRKTYGLEWLHVSNCATLEKKSLDIILRLNGAGRRYLVEDNSRKLGVDVLTKVSKNLDCIFTLHSSS